MERRDSNPRQEERAGTANTPPFGAEPPAVETAANHQIAAHSTEGGDAGGEAERPLDQAADVPPYAGIAASSETGAGRAGSAESSSRSGADRNRGGAEGWSDYESANEPERSVRAKDPISEAMIRAAERLEDAADRIEAALGGAAGPGEDRPRGRTGEMAGTLTDRMDSVASYLRANDAHDLRADIETRVRERPIQTLVIGLAAGWVTGKILR